MLQTRDVIWALLFVGCAASLQVEITPSVGEISVGDSKFFVCEVLGEPKDIDWYAPSGEKIISDKREDLSAVRSDEMTSTLTIYHAKVDSAGIYKCVARSGDQEAQATVQVKIFQRITFENTPNEQEFNEGDQADIICDVVSSPPPTIIWKHKGSKVQVAKDVRFKVMDNNHLQIHGIKKTDEGTYTCEARVMTRGEIDFRNIKVIVNVLPTIRSRQSDVNATADTGVSAVLACDADGFPEPTVTWERNKVPLETNDKYSLNGDGSELIIKDVKKVDEGDYSCIAKNKAGEKAEEVSLNVFVQPKITYLSNQTASELEEQVTLTCKASGDPTPGITWSFGRRVFTEGEQSLDKSVVVQSHARVSSLTLKQVQFTDAGRYLCTARNSIGQDSQHVYLEVRYAPKIQGIVSVYTWEGNPANISCEVLAHPRASVVWFSDGLQLPSPNTTNVKIYSTPSASFLEVTPNSQSDYGSYNCTATNEIGTESKEFLLIQAVVPSAPSIERVEPFSSTALVEFEEPDSSGGVPVLRYRASWRQPGQHWVHRELQAEEGMNTVTIMGLMPETTYEIKLSAINGKGEGESSLSSTFKTEPVQYTFTISSEAPTAIPPTSIALREPNAPRLDAKLESKGNSLKVNWVKQDDGGSPIKHYLVRYRPKNVSDWKPEIRVPHSSEHVILNGLEWDTDYEVYVVAENQRGKSKPAVVSVKTASEPTTVPDASTTSGLGTGAIVGILIVVFLLLLVGIDVTCYCLNKCGLLMCIAVNFCGKAGPGAKSQDMEEGQAAFSKDESKEPIVEVRTEEEHTPNQEVGGPTEPNETTPLTEPEPTSADTSSTMVNLLPSLPASNSVSESASESATLAAAATAGGPMQAEAQAAPRSSPKNSPAPKSQVGTPKGGGGVSTPTPEVGPLVDLSETPSKTVAPASSPPPRVPEPASPSSAKADGQQKQPDPVNPPGSAQIKDLQIDRPTPDILTAPGTGAVAASQDDTIVKDEKMQSETEVKNAAGDVKTVPNEAPQANGNESKA